MFCSRRAMRDTGCVSRWRDRWRKGRVDPADVERAHNHSFKSRPELDNSALVGCFYCLAVYPSAAIEQWTDDDLTAICPECGIDSVIGDASGYPLTKRFLGAMNDRWFGMP